MSDSRSSARGKRWHLDPAADGWLDDHRPGGERIVPGAAVVGWMMEAGQPERGDWICLHQVRFLRPLRVPDGGAEVRLEVDRPSRGISEFRVIGQTVDGAGESRGESLLVTARLGLPCSPGSVPPLPPDEATRIEKRPTTFHGPSFLGISGTLRIGERGLDALMRFPGETHANLPRLGPDNATDARHLDGVFQAANHLRQLTGLVRGVPAEVGSVHVRRVDSVNEPLAVRVRWTNEAERMRVWCGDASGRSLIVVEGYRAALATFARG